MHTILVTNDDGYTSAGFLPLITELSKHDKVVAVAPDRGKSWIGKAITTKKKLRVKTIRYQQTDLFIMNGTPADCVQIGMYNLLDKKPDLVVSGINLGLNIGHARILSSGTVGAAMEASIEGVKAIASSIQIPLSVRDSIDFYSPQNFSYFSHASQITARLVRIVLEQKFDEGVDLFSMNIPFNATMDTPVETTVPFTKPYGQLFHRKKGGFLHDTPPVQFVDMEPGTDLKAIGDNTISITPLSLALSPTSSITSIKHIIQKSW